MRIRLLLVGVVRTSKKEASSEGLNTDQPRPLQRRKKKKKEKETLSYVTWDLVNLLFKSSELICSSYVALIQKILVSSWGSWLHMLFFFKFMEIKLLCNHVNCLDKPQSKAQYVFFCWEYTAQNVRGLQRYISALKILTTSLFNSMS